MWLGHGMTSADPVHRISLPLERIVTIQQLPVLAIDHAREQRLVASLLVGVSVVEQHKIARSDPQSWCSHTRGDVQRLRLQTKTSTSANNHDDATWRPNLL